MARWWHPAGQFTTDAWLGLYVPAQGTIRDLLREDHLGYEDTVNVVVRDHEGVAIAATVSTSPNTDGDVMLLAATNVVVAWFDHDGHEQGRTWVGPSPELDFVRHATRLAADESGRWFVGGSLVGLVHSRAWLVEVGGTWAWSSAASGVAGVVGVDDGIIVATPPPLPSEPWSYRSWLGELASDGSPRWEHDADFKDHVHSVLVRDTEGRLRIASSVFAANEPSVLRSCSISR